MSSILGHGGREALQVAHRAELGAADDYSLDVADRRNVVANRTSRRDANPPEGWGNPYHQGQLVVRDADVAEFAGPDGPVEFHRTEIVDTPYECE